MRDMIQSKVKLMNESGKVCTLTMDEVSLKANLQYDQKTDKVIGVEDYGNGKRSEKIATSALVFMARGIKENWKQPLGYILVNEACPGDKIKPILFNIIDELTEIGLKIETVISDLGSNFQKLLKELNITPESPWFMYKGRKIFYLVDSPHIIKAIRNNLISYNFHFNGKTASWDDIKYIFEHDQQQTFRCCPKLTKQHLHPNGFQKMKVSLATQIFSQTVASALSTYIALGALPPSAIGTAELVSNLDNIFDCLNSSCLNSPKQYRKPISTNSAHHKFIEEMLQFISQIRVKDKNGKDVTSQLWCLKALKQTLNGIMEIWKHLHEELSFQFLLTRRLNQDPLENFFGQIRAQGGNCDNPTPIQFSRAFRKLFVNNFLSAIPTGNCAEDPDVFLVKLEDRAATQNTAESEVNQPSTVQLASDTDYKCHDIEKNLLAINATTYVSGYLLKKCLTKHNCEVCHQTLALNNIEDNTQLFCMFKQFEGCKGLTVPKDVFVQHIEGMENIFVREFTNNIHRADICRYLHLKMPSISTACHGFPALYLTQLFVKMRLHYALKFGNQELVSTKRKSKKYVKVKHL